MSRFFRIGRAFTGLGLFATRPIKRGAYIATYRGPILSAQEADRREARGARYMFELNSKWTIDGSPRYNVARYINHSCRPNSKPVGRKGKIVIVASQQIEPESEITYDYGKEYFEYFLQNGGCKCAACRKRRAARRRKARLAAAARAKPKTRKSKARKSKARPVKTQKSKTQKSKTRKSKTQNSKTQVSKARKSKTQPAKTSKRKRRKQAAAA